MNNDFYGRILKSRPAYTAAEERAALREIEELTKAGSSRALTSAKNRFIERNLRLVVVLTAQHRRSPMYDDIVQAGNLGLIRAMETFDSSKGFRFNTYAAWWIRAYVRRHLYDHGRIVRIPEWSLKVIGQVDRFDARTALTSGVNARVDDVSSEFKISRERAQELLTIARQRASQTSSLDVPAHVGRNGEASSESKKDMLIGDLGQCALENERVELQRAAIMNALEGLNEPERRIIIDRFGLKDDDETTLRTIGDDLKITRERVRQVQNEALQKMRTRLLREGTEMP